jgi:hypothetical protein
VKRWPREAAASSREAVKRLLSDAPRSEVVAALAIEQDTRMQEDERRIEDMQSRLGVYARDFARMRADWRKRGASLAEQHCELMSSTRALLESPT